MAKKPEKNKPAEPNARKRTKPAEQNTEQAEAPFDVTMADLLKMVKAKCEAVEDCAECECYDGRICRIMTARPCGWMF